MNRIFKALLFDPEAFRDFKHSSEAIAFSIIVIFMAGILSGIGTYFTPAIEEQILHILVVIPITTSIGFFSWILWAGLSFLIGKFILRGTASFRDLLRNLGFAYIPSLLSFLLVFQFGVVIIMIILVWMAGIGVISTLSAQKFGIVKALITTIMVWSFFFVALANILTSLRLIP